MTPLRLPLEVFTAKTKRTKESFGVGVHLGYTYFTSVH
jgi:hypothetical protein